MRKILLAFLLILSFSSTKLLAQYEGTFGIGAHIDYATKIQRPGIGIDLQYYLTNSFRIAPSFTYFMQVKNKSMWDIDGDIHYIIPTGNTFSLYPLVGIHFSEWKNMIKKADNPDKNIYNSRLGLNAGLGFQYDFRYKARLSLEVKYQAIKDYSQVAFAFGIGFWI